jgi:hypothetical protein
MQQETLTNLFTYNAPTLDQLSRYQAISRAALTFARMVDQHTLDGMDKSAAIQLIREACMKANAAIACGGNEQKIQMEQRQPDMNDAELSRLYESLCRDIIHFYNLSEEGGKARELFEEFARHLVNCAVLDALHAVIIGPSQSTYADEGQRINSSAIKKETIMSYDSAPIPGSEKPTHSKEVEQSVIEARKLARDNFNAAVQKLVDFGAPLASTVACTIDQFVAEPYNDGIFGDEVVQEIEEIRTGNGPHLDSWAAGEPPW